MAAVECYVVRDVTLPKHFVVTVTGTDKPSPAHRGSERRGKDRTSLILRPARAQPAYPASRASVNFPAAENWEGKEALHKSCQFFEVTAAPKFGLVSPDKTVFLQREHCFLGKTDCQNRTHSTKSEATFA